MSALSVIKDLSIALGDVPTDDALEALEAIVSSVIINVFEKQHRVGAATVFGIRIVQRVGALAVSEGRATLQ